MKEKIVHRVFALILLAALAAIVMWVMVFLIGPAIGAPAPMPRHRPVRPIGHDGMVGAWWMAWGGQSGTVTLTADGGYRCRWGGITFVGSWRIDGEGRLVITESTTPHDPRSWRTYAVCLDPATMTGEVVSGCPSTTVRMRRLRGAPQPP